MYETHRTTRAQKIQPRKKMESHYIRDWGGLCYDCIPLASVIFFLNKSNNINAPEELVI